MSAKSAAPVVGGTLLATRDGKTIAAADPDKLHAYRAMGIDRISMGIQVVQPDLLKVLNRDENGIEAAAAFVLAN